MIDKFFFIRQRQQAKMAAHCRNIFGDLLLTDQLDDFPVKNFLFRYEHKLWF